MSDFLSFYQQQARNNFSNIPWVLKLQEKANVDFAGLGFPNHHQEDWKYTKLETFLQQSFSNASSGSVSIEATLTDYPVLIENPISLINGELVGYETLVSRLPAGVIVQPLSQALLEHEDKIKPHLNHILKQQHGFHALNTAMLRVGIFIYVPADVCITMPILLSHWQDNSDQAVYLRHLVVMEQGSSLSLIEDYQGDANTRYFTNTITEIALAPRAQLTHYKLQRESHTAFHVGHIAAKQAADSQFSSHSLSMGGRWVRSDISIDLQEPKANCLMNGIYVPTDGQHVDHHTRVNHEAPNCQSIQDYKGILSGKSRAVFNGQIIVAKDAQKTKAQQNNKNLLLSTNTEIDTKPQLEIYADDVTCTHGATVGQLDEDALFYFATRGIERTEAIRYLVQAFMVENLQLLAEPALATWIGSLL